MAQRGFEWPNQARIAVVVTCLLENWSEGKGPPFSVQTTALKPGTHDRAAMTWGTYGVRAGVWRLLKILDENKVPATFAANAHSLELNPAAAKQIIDVGSRDLPHIPICRTRSSPISRRRRSGRSSARRRTSFTRSPARRRKAGSARCSHQPITPRPSSPRRAFSGTATTTTSICRSALRSDRARSSPCPTPISPITACCAPIRATGIDVYKDTFDYLYANEPTSYLNITVHCHFGGRPLIAAQVDRILKYIRGFPRVWIVRHDELAQWVLDNDIREWTNGERFYPQAG